MSATLGRPRSAEPRLDQQIVVPVTANHREQLLDEARRAGYRSLAAYLRDRRLTPQQALAQN